MATKKLEWSTHLSDRPSQPIHTKLVTWGYNNPPALLFLHSDTCNYIRNPQHGVQKKCTREAYLRQDRIHTMTNSKYMYIYILYAHIGALRVSAESDCWSSPLQLNNLLADVTPEPVLSTEALVAWLVTCRWPRWMRGGHLDWPTNIAPSAFANRGHTFQVLEAAECYWQCRLRATNNGS